MNFAKEFGGYPYIFRFRSPNENSISELEESYVYFSNRDNLNDPHDANPRMVNFTENPSELVNFFNFMANSFPDEKSKAEFIAENTPDTLREFMKDKIEFYVLHYGIVCFSVHLKNYPLWANYADNSSGLCLQFNVEKDKNLFSDLRPMNYAPEPTLINYNPQSENDNLTELFFHKTSDWSYEKEWRLLKVHNGRFYFNPNALEKIIIGYNAKPEFIEKVKNIVRNKYPNSHLFLMKKPTEFDKLSLITL